MNCPKCNYVMTAFDAECARCHGQGVAEAPPLLHAPPPPPPDGGGATASLALGGISLLAWFVPLVGLPITLLGLVMGWMSRKSVNGEKASIGMALCAVGLLATVARFSMTSYAASHQVPLSGPNLSAFVPTSKMEEPLLGSGYKIAPVAGWTLTEKPDPSMPTDNIITAPEKDGFKPNLNVVVVRTKWGETMESDKVEVAQELPKMFTNYHQVSNRDVIVDGQQGWEWYATQDVGQSAQKMWSRQVMVIKDGRAWTFTCSNLDANHALTEKDFDAMLSSVHWIN